MQLLQFDDDGRIITELSRGTKDKKLWKLQCLLKFSAQILYTSFIILQAHSIGQSTLGDITN